VLKNSVNNSLGIRVNLGTDVIHHADYLRTIPEVKKGLNNLHKYPLLAADIETLSLNFYETGIETIAFAWDEHNGNLQEFLKISLVFL
jgi:DNA polymerase-1